MIYTILNFLIYRMAFSVSRAVLFVISALFLSVSIAISYLGVTLPFKVISLIFSTSSYLIVLFILFLELFQFLLRKEKYKVLCTYLGIREDFYEFTTGQVESKIHQKDTPEGIVGDKKTVFMKVIKALGENQEFNFHYENEAKGKEFYFYLSMVSILVLALVFGKLFNTVLYA